MYLPSLNRHVDILLTTLSKGTTGMPKGVMLTHRNIVANALQASRFDLKALSWDSDAQLAMLPFYHIYVSCTSIVPCLGFSLTPVLQGLSPVLNATWQTGAPAIVMAKWDIEKACRLVEQHGITFIYCPPPVVLALAKHPIVDKFDLSSVKWINSGAAPLSGALVNSMWERHKIPVKQGYGLSETSPTTHTQFTNEFMKFQGSVGRLFANMQAKIVDEEGNEVPEGGVSGLHSSPVVP